MQIRKSLELPLIFFIVGIFVIYTFLLLCPFKCPVGLMATSTIRVDKTPSRCPLDYGIPGLTSATLRTWTSVHVHLLCFDSVEVVFNDSGPAALFRSHVKSF